MLLQIITSAPRDIVDRTASEICNGARFKDALAAAAAAARRL